MSRIASSLFVKCPHPGCGWMGRIPSSPDGEYGSDAGNVSFVWFHCPHCEQSWRARVIDDDVEALPLETLDADPDAVAWPPIELGVGD